MVTEANNRWYYKKKLADCKHLACWARNEREDIRKLVAFRVVLDQHMLPSILSIGIKVPDELGQTAEQQICDTLRSVFDIRWAVKCNCVDTYSAFQ